MQKLMKAFFLVFSVSTLSSALESPTSKVGIFVAICGDQVDDVIQSENRLVKTIDIPSVEEGEKVYNFVSNVSDKFPTPDLIKVKIKTYESADSFQDRLSVKVNLLDVNDYKKHDTGLNAEVGSKAISSYGNCTGDNYGDYDIMISTLN